MESIENGNKNKSVKLRQKRNKLLSVEKIK